MEKLKKPRRSSVLSDRVLRKNANHDVVTFSIYIRFFILALMKQFNMNQVIYHRQYVIYYTDQIKMVSFKNIYI